MKAILIDDEPLALNYLEYQLLNIAEVEIVGKYTDPLIGKRAIETNEVDIVFLDIEIPKVNGIELAEQLLEIKPALHIVFVTAYGEYATKAFELNALDYVLKPVVKQRLTITVQRIQSRMKELFALTSRRMGTLKMNLFKEVSIIDGETRIPLRWRTTKAQQLFLYLVQFRGQIVNKPAIAEMLWPDLDMEKAYQQLYTAIYYIRKTLAPYEKYFQIHSATEGYRLNMKHIVLDVDQFEQFFRSELTLSEESVGHYERMIDIVSGEYLQDYDYIWAESERQRFQTIWVQVALDMANWYYERNEQDKAIALCLDICQRYPLEEEAYFILMKLYAASGRRASVHKQYEQLKNVLMKEIQEEPMTAITQWYHHWRQMNNE